VNEGSEADCRGLDGWDADSCGTDSCDEVPQAVATLNKMAAPTTEIERTFTIDLHDVTGTLETIDRRRDTQLLVNDYRTVGSPSLRLVQDS
jgi:hypothetical protein